MGFCEDVAFETIYNHVQAQEAVPITKTMMTKTMMMKTMMMKTMMMKTMMMMMVWRKVEVDYLTDN